MSAGNELTQDDADRLAKEAGEVTTELARYGAKRFVTKRSGEWWVQVAHHRVPSGFHCKGEAMAKAERIIDGMARKSRQAQAAVFAGEYLRGESPASEIPAFLALWSDDIEDRETSQALAQLGRLTS